MATLTIDFAEDVIKFKKLLSSLGGKRRIRILKLISDGKDWTISDMAKRMDCGIPNVSQQVTELEKAGLIVKQLSKTQGNNMKFIKPVYDEILIRLKE